MSNSKQTPASLETEPAVEQGSNNIDIDNVENDEEKLQNNVKADDGKKTIGKTSEKEAALNENVKLENGDGKMEKKGEKNAGAKDDAKKEKTGLSGKKKNTVPPAIEKKKWVKRKFPPREEIAEAREKKRQALREGGKKVGSDRKSKNVLV